MITSDIIFLVFCLLQPPFIGMLLFSITKQGLLNKQVFSQVRFMRKKLKGSRYFECAVQPRLVGRLTYDIQVLSFVLIFIVYDVDLILFFSEIMAYDLWSFTQCSLFVLYALFFFAGIYYDVRVQKIKWQY